MNCALRDVLLDEEDEVGVAEKRLAPGGAGSAARWRGAHFHQPSFHHLRINNKSINNYEIVNDKLIIATGWRGSVLTI